MLYDIWNLKNLTDSTQFSMVGYNTLMIAGRHFFWLFMSVLLIFFLSSSAGGISSRCCLPRQLIDCVKASVPCEIIVAESECGGCMRYWLLSTQLISGTGYGSISP